MARISSRSAEAILRSMAQGSYGKGIEIIDWVYYDTLVLNAAVNQTTMFQVPVNGAAGVNLARTNMVAAGQIPTGQNFVVQAIRTLVFKPTLSVLDQDMQDLNNMLANTTMEFMIANKPSMLTLCVSDLLGPSLLQQYVAPAATVTSPQSLSPRFHGVWPLNTPLVLAATVHFEYLVTHRVAVAASVTNTWLKIGLLGKLARVG